MAQAAQTSKNDSNGSKVGQEPEERAALGILFVHGIGEQRRGGTLVQFLDPLIRHLQQWITVDHQTDREREEAEKRAKYERSKIKPRRTRKRAEAEALASTAPDSRDRTVVVSDIGLRSAGETSGEPAHLKMTITPAPPGDERPSPATAETSTWCVAESWWAEEFETPQFKAIARWALNIAPAVITRQLTKSFDRRLRSVAGGTYRPRWLKAPVFAAHFLTAVVVVCIGYMVAALTEVALLLLLVLGTIPIPKVSGFIAKVGGRIATSVGDSYVLIESPTQLAAMVNRVRRDLEWLAGRCDKVAVVGHSQGAVIAHFCLCQYSFPNVERFITVGSGLSKLYELIRLNRRWSVHLGQGRATLYSFVLSVVIAYSAWWISDGQVFVALYWFSLLGLAQVAMLIFIFHEAMATRIEEERRSRGLLDLHDAPRTDAFRWRDFFASVDPVPNGQLFDDPPAYFESRPVWNRASILTDHTTYISNPDGFIAPFVAELAELLPNTPLGVALQQEQKYVQRAGHRRAWRLGWLVGARWAVFPTGLFAAWRIRHDLVEAAGVVINWTPDWIRTVVGKTVEVVQAVWDPLHGRSHAVVASLLAATGLWLAYKLVYATWRWWDKRDITRFYQRRPADLGGTKLAWFVIVTVGVAGAALLIVVLSRPVRLNYSSMMLVVSLGFAFMVLGFTISRWRKQPEDLQSPEEREQLVVLMFQRSIVAVVLVVVLLPMAFAAGALFLEDPPIRSFSLGFIEHFFIRSFSLGFIVALMATAVTGRIIRLIEPLGGRIGASLVRRSLGAPAAEPAGRAEAVAEESRRSVVTS